MKNGGKGKAISFEAMYPTRAARELADAATDALSESEPMTKYIDVWLEAYFGAGGVDGRAWR